MRRTAAAGIAAALAIAPAAPADAASKRRTCAAKGSKTVVSNKHVRVYKRGWPPYHACWRRTGRRRQLWTYDYDSVGPFRLRGEYVAYIGIGPPATATGDDIWVVNVRTGKERVLEFAASRGGESYEWIWDFVLGRSGAVAWIHERSAFDGESWSVQKWSRSGRLTLDPGPAVERGSLALTPSGRRVYWINAGEPRSARLR